MAGTWVRGWFIESANKRGTAMDTITTLFFAAFNTNAPSQLICESHGWRMG